MQLKRTNKTMKKFIKLNLIFTAIILAAGCTVAPITKNKIEKPILHSVIEHNSTTTINCVGLGQNGPNVSMGPNDPNMNKKCCEGLVLKTPIRCAEISKTNDNCNSMEGCGTVCIACGDNICDPIFENKCNCKEDCK